MGTLRRHKKKSDQYVVAVQVDLETDGFSYRKWGSLQECKKGDWLVDNAGDVYTIDREVFERTYERVGDGRYVKTTPVWAERAPSSGSVKTRAGKSQYEEGDYLVSNNPDRTDAYCAARDIFEKMYELDE